MLPETSTDLRPSHLTVVAQVVVRLCQQTDLELLEWFGQYTHHREILQNVFARHLCGESVMLVADLNDYPVAQAWLDLVKRKSEGVGYIWAVRVFPFLRGLGIGTQLMEYAEDVLRQRGFTQAELGVEKTNAAANRLYMRLGYQLHMQLQEKYDYTTADGAHARHVVDQWILRKHL